MEIVWRYLNTEGAVARHGFEPKNKILPFCGYPAYLSYLPNPWKEDDKGLATKRPCKKCVKIINTLKQETSNNPGTALVP